MMHLDAERLVKRLVANELILSFVPDAEQRLWRTVMRGKYQLTRNHARVQNRLEALLEEAHIKLSSLVSDLLGASARRMLKRHRLCRLIWLILHQGVRYEERGPAVSRKSRQRRTAKMIRERLGTTIRARPVNPPAPTRRFHPEQTLLRRSPCMVVRHSGPFVKAASVP